MNCMKKVFYPEVFQGKYKRMNYFEGWYFKLVDKTSDNSYAIIPGISRNEEDTHAFIQVLDANNNVDYIRYEMSEFQYRSNEFDIKIGDNYFSRDRIRLDIRGSKMNMKGQLKFTNIIELPKTIFRPGIMGPFSYIPFMECYHGIINIQHDITGQLVISGKPVDFTEGKGYIEKNWGTSMPESWVWLQSNHFNTDDVSLVFSVAKIPFSKMSFTGFFCMFRYTDRVYVFATYTGARIRLLDYGRRILKVVVEDHRYRMSMKVTNPQGGDLKAPLDGMMEREITENLNTQVQIRFMEKTGRILYEGRGNHTGLEIVE